MAAEETPLKPLPAEALCRWCDAHEFPFSTTAELEDLTEVVGQERAVEAIRFALGMKREGYNVFVLGPSGIGKHVTVRRLLRHRASRESVPPDWCYVYNFARPHKPETLQVPAGYGVKLRDSIDQLIDELRTAIPAVLESDDYRTRRKSIEDEVKRRQQEAFSRIQEEAKAAGITIMQTETGIVFAPVRDGQMMPSDAFNALPETERERIQEQIQALQERFRETMQMVPRWAREAGQRLRDLEREVTGNAVKAMIEERREQFKAFPQVVEHLNAFESDVINNVAVFVNPASALPPQVQGQAQSSGPGELGRPTSEHPAYQRYRVNVLVDRNHLDGAPVVYADHPTYQELFGAIEHAAEFGALVTDFTKIKPGALHRANGGYLILDARKVLMEPFVWEGLKHALRSREIRIEHPTQAIGVISTQSLSPRPIPLSIKVMLIGERRLYYLLDQGDPDFAELFKVTADFDDQVKRTHDNNMTYARIIGTMARREGLHAVSNGAVARLCDHSARLAGDAERMSTRMRPIHDLVREADYFTTQAGHDVIEAADVEQAIEAAFGRVSRLREELQEQIVRGTVLIDTEGAKVGQINGLSVLQLGRFAFGKPSRITARLRVGAGKVVDIEREVELGGPLHSKGVLILSSYLSSQYATDQPFSLAASLVFEQSYGGVDGDSASSAELYALLSALSEVAIKQSFAVTGSVNQNGEVQAIGGANEKIEGFFDLCNERGLSGDQGVLIPQANVKNLMLRRDVIEAVRAGRFHIYPVDHVNEGIAILTGVDAGVRRPDGQFPSDSINGLVEKRLNALAEHRRAFTRQNGEQSPAQ